MEGFELLTDIDAYNPFFLKWDDRREQMLWDTVSGRPPADQALPSATHLASLYGTTPYVRPEPFAPVAAMVARQAEL